MDRDPLGGAGPLAAAMARLEVLIDWERRDRSAGALQSMRVDVGPSRDLCARVGAWPPRVGEPAPVVIHVAGSKGKGSVCALVDAGLRAAGWRTGRYGSPHVERVAERVVLNGEPVDDSRLAQALERVMDVRDGALAESGGLASKIAASTWFDVLTAAAFWIFRGVKLDAWVIECGLGGRLDSTNVVDGEVAVVTGIELEHTAILGDTRAAIAGEKAGILKPGGRVIVGLEPPHLMSSRPDATPDAPDSASVRIAAVAARVGVPVEWRPRTPGDSFDAHNRRIAAAVLDGLGAAGHRASDGTPLAGTFVLHLPPDAARLPGRWEHMVVAGTPVVLDGAHVATSLSALLDQLAADPRLPGAPVVVLGMGKDKDTDALLKCLLGRTDRVLCSSAGAGPYLAPELLSAKARALGLETETVFDPRVAVQRALAVAKGRWVLVTGSLHLVGAVRAALIEVAQPGSPC